MSAWIFVSHASADLTEVRKVRNQLEMLGASPLLFHLISLRSPRRFWPIIKQEVRDRNFFLYCESAAAEKSDWVRRERELVERERRKHPKAIAHIRVDGSELDFSALPHFVTAMNALPMFGPSDEARARPYLRAMTRAGFRVLDHTKSEDITEARTSNCWLISFYSLANPASEVSAIPRRYPTDSLRRIAIVLDEASEPDKAETGKWGMVFRTPHTGPATVVDYMLANWDPVSAHATMASAQVRWDALSARSPGLRGLRK